MKIFFSSVVKKELEKIKKKDTKLLSRIQKQLSLFKSDPKHHSLRVHKLSGKQNNMWSISVSSSLRMVYVLLEDQSILFIDLGTHDEVYYLEL